MAVVLPLRYLLPIDDTAAAAKMIDNNLPIARRIQLRLTLGEKAGASRFFRFWEMDLR